MARATWIGWAVAIVCLAGGAALFVVPMLQDEEAKARTQPGPLIETVEVQPMSDPVSITQTAFVRAADSIDIVPEVGGRVARVNAAFSIGAQIAEGATLFTLKDETYRTEVARAQARVTQAQAVLQQSRNSLNRQEELEDGNFASEATLEEAQTARIQAEGDLAFARAELRSAQIALEDTTVTAPFDAIVTDKDISAGQLIEAGSRTGALARSGFAEVRVGLTERQFTILGGRRALMGKPVSVQPRRIGPVMHQGSPRSGQITSVSPVINANARVNEVTVRINDPFAAQGAGAPMQINQLVTVSFRLPDTDAQLYAAPLGVLQSGDAIWSVDAKSTLRRLDASIRRQTSEQVYFTAQGYSGQPLMLTPLDTPVEGLKVRVAARDSQTVQARND